jgi:hypothetical protein
MKYNPNEPHDGRQKEGRAAATAPAGLSIEEEPNLAPAGGDCKPRFERMPRLPGTIVEELLRELKVLSEECEAVRKPGQGWLARTQKAKQQIRTAVRVKELFEEMAPWIERQEAAYASRVALLEPL